MSPLDVMIALCTDSVHALCFLNVGRILGWWGDIAIKRVSLSFLTFQLNLFNQV